MTRYTLILSIFCLSQQSAQAGIRVLNKTKSQYQTCWILSIGIDSYPPLALEHCSTDANTFGRFLAVEYQRLSLDSTDQNIRLIVLANEDATKKNILDTLNYIGQHADSMDLFAFYFGGFAVTYKEENDVPKAALLPFNKNQSLINYLSRPEEAVISMIQLNEAFQFIDAEDQLICIDANNESSFHLDLLRPLLLENAKTSHLETRNRVLITPNGKALSSVNCKEFSAQSGALVYILISLSDNHNLFHLISKNEDKRKNLTYAIRTAERKCSEDHAEYVFILFESKFLSQVFQLTEGLQSLRGNDVLSRKSTSSYKMGQKYALLVGTNSYQKNSGWSQLNNPELDILAIGKELEDHYEFQVQFLTSPCRDTLYKNIMEYHRMLDSNDQFVLYICGHGDFDPILDDGFIVCSDSENKMVDLSRKSYLQFSALSKLVNNFPCKQVMVMLDVCFGGVFDSRLSRDKDRGNGAYSELSRWEYLDQKLKHTTRLYITSGGNNVVPEGYSGNHSPFARLVLKALRSYGGDLGFITATHLYEVVQLLPSEPRIGSFGDDEPGSEFVLIAKKMNGK